MDIAFMSGGLIINLLYAILQFTIAIVLGYHGYQIYKNYQANKESETPVRSTIEKSHIHIIMIGVLFFLLTAVNPAVMPKREIATIDSRPQIEYNRGFEVEIVTPPERTERMDGFRPLKETE